jgi:imidazolonepropionase-like amidohydrolase
MRTPIVFAAAMACAAMSLPPQNSAAPPVTAFVNVNVLPMDRNAVLSDQTVVVRDSRIVSVGPAASVTVPPGAQRVDARGKFLMPALAEMHAHIPGGAAPDAEIERTLFLYAANGVGTIRGMLGHPRHLEYRERVAKGELFSPRIYTSGPSFNDKTAPTPEAAVKAVIEQKAAGYDLLKIHPGVPRAAFDALDQKADELGIPFAGHVPLQVGLHRALAAKYKSIDHLDGYVEALAKNPYQSQFFGLNLVNEVDESRIPSLVAETKAAGTWMVPTQILMESLLNEESTEAMAQWPEMKYVPRQTLQNWIDQKAGMTTKVSAADRGKLLALRRNVVKALLAGGVPFALGSDAPQWWNVPGFSAHRELKTIVSAGFSPFQALESGTINAARYFGTASATGSVASGMRADLILLDANPLDNIDNTTKIAGVMLNGRWMSRADLDKRLGEVAKQAASGSR